MPTVAAIPRASRAIAVNRVDGSSLESTRATERPRTVRMAKRNALSPAVVAEKEIHSTRMPAATQSTTRGVEPGGMTRQPLGPWVRRLSAAAAPPTPSAPAAMGPAPWKTITARPAVTSTMPSARPRRPGKPEDGWPRLGSNRGDVGQRVNSDADQEQRYEQGDDRQDAGNGDDRNASSGERAGGRLHHLRGNGVGHAELNYGKGRACNQGQRGDQHRHARKRLAGRTAATTRQPDRSRAGDHPGRPGSGARGPP